MIKQFRLCGDIWNVKFVGPHDPILIDRQNILTIGVTDPATMTIYLSDRLRGELLNRVFIHELGHATLFSSGLIADIHRMVKKNYWIEAEEWVCNFIADYGREIFGAAYAVLGDQAIYIVPKQIEKRFI